METAERSSLPAEGHAVLGSIVVGTDGSAGSVAALTWALGEAGRRGCAVDAVLVWSDPYGLTGPPTPVALAGSTAKHLRSVMDKSVAAAERECVGAPVTVRHHLRSGNPAEVLATAAKEATLLVVGSRGYGAFRGSLLGSVSQRSAQRTTTPIVIVHGAEEIGSAGAERPRRIVVGVDGSENSLIALRWAMAEAALWHAPLDVVGAWGSANYGLGGGAKEEQLRTQTEAILEDALADAGREGAPISLAVEHGPAAGVLVGASRGADLLVVGSRGRGALAGFVLGSVSQQCAAHASCPVGVVPDSGNPSVA